MADDIVTRLREQAQAPALSWLDEVADEIERLRQLCDDARGWLNHDRGCSAVAAGSRFGPPHACTCGLDDLLLTLEGDRD